MVMDRFCKLDCVTNCILLLFVFQMFAMRLSVSVVFLSILNLYNAAAQSEMYTMSHSKL